VVNETPVVLVVEDDELMQGVLEDALREGGFETAISASGERRLRC
jgi:CheY-like chemotaxis protein